MKWSNIYIVAASALASKLIQHTSQTSKTNFCKRIFQLVLFWLMMLKDAKALFKNKTKKQIRNCVVLVLQVGRLCCGWNVNLIRQL